MSRQTFETVTYAVEARVALVTLNRPERLNAFNGQMAMDLKAAMARAVADPEVRAIVLAGAGRGFCSGADISSLAGGVPISGDPKVMAELDASFASRHGPDVAAAVAGAERLGYFIRTKKPIIAAINGPAAGMGLLLALYADVRFAACDATFVTAFGQRGMIAEHGLAWLLSRHVGMGNAVELLLSSRKLPAKEAKAMGLVNHLTESDELLDRVLSYARHLAATMPPRAMAVMKAQIWHAAFESFDAALATALAETQLSLKHPDLQEGIASFRDKRPPAFASI